MVRVQPLFLLQMLQLQVNYFHLQFAFRNQMSKKIQHGQSKSLWNYTLSPGWKQNQVRVLKLVLQKFGIGHWKKIQTSGCLPGKSIGQIYMQTQRLVGQQSLGQFMGLHLDLQRIFNDNMQKKNVIRKNNSIINSGDNQTKQQRKRLIQQNKRLYGLTQEYVSSIKLPRYGKKNSWMTIEQIDSDLLTTVQKIQHLARLRAQIERRLASEVIDSPEAEG